MTNNYLTKKQWFLVLIFNIILATGFYLHGIKAPVTAISSDLANIIPICQKLDNPNLFQNDLYLNEVNNIKYYTPFYVQTLRFIAKFTNHDYIQALNIFSFITHFLYGFLWFYCFFLLRKDFWLAFGFSIFMRGIIWPPGMELLGISELWTIMPRTVFAALIPLPFIIYVLSKGKWILFSGLVLGLLVNFHPISGVGAVIVYLSVFFANYYYQNNQISFKFIKQLFGLLIAIFIGLLPYFLTYFLNVKLDNSSINQELFNQAINARINPIFFNGILFLQSWHRPVTYFFLFTFLLFFFFDSSLQKRTFKILFFSIVVLLFFCNGIVELEKIINTEFHSNLRFGFQLVRAQKSMIVIMQVGFFLLLFEIIQKFSITNVFKRNIVLVYIFLLTLSTAPFIHKIPLLGEDISTYILPNSFKIFPLKEENDLIIPVFDFVNKNTSKESVFYCRNVYFRTATQRAEALDFHAAGILIEGNPQQYIRAYQNNIKFNSNTETQNILLLKEKKVTYIIDTKKWNLPVLLYKNSKYYIYKI